MSSKASLLPKLHDIPPNLRAIIDRAWVNGGELWIACDMTVFRADDLRFYGPIYQLRSRASAIGLDYAPVGPIDRASTLEWKWCGGRLVHPVMDEHGKALP
jgi:hypothetical protein